MKASDSGRGNLRFTPYPHEPVGWLVEQAGPELCMFSADYPHIEGGRNPLKRFELSPPNLSESAKEKFSATTYPHMTTSLASYFFHLSPMSLNFSPPPA